MDKESDRREGRLIDNNKETSNTFNFSNLFDDIKTFNFLFWIVLLNCNIFFKILLQMFCFNILCYILCFNQLISKKVLLRMEYYFFNILINIKIAMLQFYKFYKHCYYTI